MSTIYTLGPVGSYSSKAANKVSKGISGTIEYKENIKDVIEATLHGSYGIVPMHNVYGGIVQESYKNIIKHKYLIQTLTFVMLHINHCLASANDESIKDLKTIYSHPQALKQCESYLSAIHVVGIPVSSTTEKLASLKFSEGIVCSYDTAKHAGLNIIDDDVAPADNMTVFALISNEEYASSFKKILNLS